MRNQLVWRLSRGPYEDPTEYFTISLPVAVADSSGSPPRRPVRITRAMERDAELLKLRAALLAAWARPRVGRRGAKEGIVLMGDWELSGWMEWAFRRKK